MVCTTIKKGVECVFMTENGCNYNGGSCHEVVEACEGCQRITEISAGWYCTACPDPTVKWRLGHCNLATHKSVTTVQSEAKVNPLKASKRAHRARR